MVVNKYRICSKTVLDNSIEGISFDENGVCNFVRDFEKRLQQETVSNKQQETELTRIINKIKKCGKRKKYNCIIGVSGGVDSSYVAYLVKKHNLRPLAIHFDNGWNSGLALKNIENLLKVLEIDLYTYVVNWDEFKDLQLAFIKSSIRNLEIPTDHAIFALLYKIAAKHGIKYIISGSNLATEGIMPSGYGENSRDLKLIKSIHKIFGTKKLKTFPRMGLLELSYYVFIKRIKHFRILNYVDYNKEEAIKKLEQKIGWIRYDDKHFESIFTRFFQAYILPEKYHVDKRRAHFSSLIMSNQMTREDALFKLAEPPYVNKNILLEDLKYFKQKFDLTDEEFNEIMNQPIRSYKDYSSSHWVFENMPALIQVAKRIANNA